jgi:hypothetical protein
VSRTGSENEIGEKRYWDLREWRTHSELYLVRNGIELFSPNALLAFPHRKVSLRFASDTLRLER